MKKILLVCLAAVLAVPALAQRVVDKLDRGIVAIPYSSGGNLVSWRIFGDEYYDVEYNVYRNGGATPINSAPLRVSNFVDASGNSSSRYQVAPVVRGVEQEKSAEVRAWSTNYKFVPVVAVVNRDGKTIGNSVAGNSGGNDTTTSGYTLNDISLADVDGDGVCEFIVKRNNSQGNLRSASNNTDFNLYECYTMEGKRLWWIDLGPNLMAGADEQWDMIGYDWDRDGKAEMIMRGADNMIIHTATGKTINIGNMTSGFGYERPEYMGVGKEYLLYLNGETGEPYGWDGEENWTPMDYPLPQFEANETAGDANVWGDLGHRMMKHYLGAPYIDGRHASIFLGRGCYTRHKACVLDVNPNTHELTVRWRWNCYDSSSPWFGNGFHNFAIADVDMDGRDEIVYGSMILDDTGYGLATTGLGHGDAQHCGDLDPYRWGLEQFTCQEGSQGNSYWNATTGDIYYRKQDGGDDGRSLAGNFTNLYPGGQGRSVGSGVIGLSSDRVIDSNGDVMSGTYSNLNNRIYWDGDLLDEIFNSKNGANRSGNIFKWGGSVIRSFTGISNNWTKCNPSAQGDILGDWREELVLRLADNSGFHIYVTDYATSYRIPTLWHDHVYRNGMAWQCVGYNQPPHVSFFLGELEGITQAPPPLILTGRTEVTNGAVIGSALDGQHILLCEQADAEVTIEEGAQPWVFTDNAAVWVQGSGDRQATQSTPKSPARTYIEYTHAIKGAAFTGATRVVKQGEGTLVLPAVEQTYTGNTDVWNGKLKFDGTLVNSALWLNRHTTLVTDGGRFLKSIAADYNATINIGDGKKSTLTVDSLALNFGSRVIFDLYGDNSCDQVKARIITLENKTWSFGPHYAAPVFEFRYDGEIADGRYLLAEGYITGNIDEVVLEGIATKRHILTYEEGKLYLEVEPMRDAADISWTGAESNLWDFGVSKNFDNNGEADYAVLGDNIVFDDRADRNSIMVKGQVRPASITFNNETKNFTLTGMNGNGIYNEPPLTKNGGGKVTMLTINDMGNTVVNGGTLEVDALSSQYMSMGVLGSVDKTISLNNDATLALSDIVLTDQVISVSGEPSVYVAEGKSLTLNKGVKSSDKGVLHKKGAGSLTMGTDNTFAKLVIDVGRVNAVSKNNVDQYPDTVEFVNGVLWSTTMDDTPGRTSNVNFIVPQGGKASFYGPYRGSYSGKVTGSGSLSLYSGGVRCVWGGDFSQFEGTLSPGTYQRQAKPSYDPSFDWSISLPKGVMNLNAGVTVNTGSSSLTFANISGSGTVNGSGTIIFGSNDEDCNFRGVFYNVGVVKDGAGTWTINSSSPQQNLKSILVRNGKLYVYTLTNSTAYINSQATITLRNTGELQGTAIVPSISAESGSTVTVGRMNVSNPSGELKVINNCVLRAGTTLVMNINNATSSSSAYTKLTVGGILSFNGTLKLTLNSSYQPKDGDTFQLWTAKTFMGTPQYELPELPEGLMWDTSSLAAASGVLKVVSVPESVRSLIAASEVSCEVYGMDGVKRAEFTCTDGDLRQAALRHNIGRGTWLIRLSAAGKQETLKMTF